MPNTDTQQVKKKLSFNKFNTNTFFSWKNYGYWLVQFCPSLTKIDQNIRHVIQNQAKLWIVSFVYPANYLNELFFTVRNFNRELYTMSIYFIKSIDCLRLGKIFLYFFHRESVFFHLVYRVKKHYLVFMMIILLYNTFVDILLFIYLFFCLCQT